jgi:hypothetical protein
MGKARNGQKGEEICCGIFKDMKVFFRNLFLRFPVFIRCGRWGRQEREDYAVNIS